MTSKPGPNKAFLIEKIQIHNGQGHDLRRGGIIAFFDENETNL